jgi:plastocyanin
MSRTLFVFLLTLSACSSPPAPNAPAARDASTDASAAVADVTGRAPSGALVMLEPVAESAPMPQGPAVMDQFSKSFVPDTLFVRVGQPVTFKNSEDQLHNVTVVRSRTGAGVMNISQNQGDVHTHTFDQPGEYEVTCDVHPGMRATIVASTTPYATYAQTGTFRLANVTPGEYRLRILASGRETTTVVTVPGGRVDLSDAAR